MGHQQFQGLVFVWTQNCRGAGASVARGSSASLTFLSSMQQARAFHRQKRQLGLFPCPTVSELPGKFTPPSCCLSLAQARLAASSLPLPPPRCPVRPPISQSRTLVFIMQCLACSHLIVLYLTSFICFPVCFLRPGAVLCHSLASRQEGWP